LEPTHGERVELVFSGREVERVPGFVSEGEHVLAAYDDALRLMNDTPATVERDVVAVALQMARHTTPACSDLLRSHAPSLCGAAEAWSAGRAFASPSTFSSNVDRRGFGLLAFLTNRAKECHEAWAPLEMAGDPFIDAAAGQLHLERGDAAKAYARFAVAARE